MSTLPTHPSPVGVNVVKSWVLLIPGLFLSPFKGTQFSWTEVAHSESRAKRSIRVCANVCIRVVCVRAACCGALQATVCLRFKYWGYGPQQGLGHAAHSAQEAPLADRFVKLGRAFCASYTAACLRLEPGGGGAIPRVLGRQLPLPPPPPSPRPLGASGQQLVAKGVALRRPWAPKAPDAP